jgi:hypothetical protein
MDSFEIEKPAHFCGATAKATGFDDSFIVLRGTSFVPLEDPLTQARALTEM